MYIKPLFYNKLTGICTKPGIDRTLTDKIICNLFKMTSYIDIQQSITAANGNAALAKDLFTMLLEDLDLRHQQIKTSFEERDLKSLEEHAHKLYGATAYCIAPKLRTSTAALEQAVISGQFTELNELVTRVLQDMENLIAHGPEYLNKEWSTVK